MSIRTTVTLDDDVLERVKAASARRAAPFRRVLNDLLREALAQAETAPRKRKLKLCVTDMGRFPGIDYGSTKSMLEAGEGPSHR
jgi:hypothetical protein